MSESASPHPAPQPTTNDPLMAFVESFAREPRPNTPARRAIVESVLDFRGSATDEQLRHFVMSWFKAYEELEEYPDGSDPETPSTLNPRTFLNSYQRTVIGSLKQARGCLVANKNTPYIMKTINLLSHSHIGNAGQLAFLDGFFKSLYKHFALQKSRAKSKVSSLEDTVSALTQEVRRLNESNSEISQKLSVMELLVNNIVDDARDVRTLTGAQTRKLAAAELRALDFNTHNTQSQLNAYRERCEVEARVASASPKGSSVASPNGSSRAEKRYREEDIRSSLNYE